MLIPAFFQAAARLSGRVDWSGACRQGVDPSGLDPRALAELGLSPRHVSALRAGVEADSPDPFLTLRDAAWPSGLAEAPFAPAILFCRGDPTLLAQPGLAVVGTRRCTDTGLRLARTFSAAAVDLGAVVVSGLAWGVDMAAHEVALSRTIAVLGQGLDTPLSSHQARLADQILAAGGLLVSEFLPGTRPERWTFPQRNRVIAALARATVVIEAPRRSGALITARLAVELGREVLAVPGSPLAEASAGCLDLIAQGARMCREIGDIREALGLAAEGATPRRRSDPLGLVEHLGDGLNLDELLSVIDASPVEILRALAGLELTGVVMRLPGDRYAAVVPP